MYLSFIMKKRSVTIRNTASIEVKTVYGNCNWSLVIKSFKKWASHWWNTNWISVKPVSYCKCPQIEGLSGKYLNGLFYKQR